MKYTTTTGVERVEDFIKNSILTEVENESFKFDRSKFVEQTHNLSLFEKRSYLSRELSKNLLPSLHQKIHYKGLQELSNRVGSTMILNAVSKSVQLIRRTPVLTPVDDKSTP